MSEPVPTENDVWKGNLRLVFYLHSYGELALLIDALRHLDEDTEEPKLKARIMWLLERLERVMKAMDRGPDLHSRPVDVRGTRDRWPKV